MCLRLDENQGKGAAVRHALARIAPGDFTHVLFMDGDGQHRPEDIPSLVEQARASGADLVIGARALDRSRMPRSRHFSNTVGSRVASWLVGRAVLDSQSGFRLVRIERLKTLRLRARRYELEMEVLIKLCRQGASVAHAPVALVYDGGRARSKMHPIRDTVRICLWSLAFRYLGRLRLGPAVRRRCAAVTRRPLVGASWAPEPSEPAAGVARAAGPDLAGRGSRRKSAT